MRKRLDVRVAVPRTTMAVAPFSGRSSVLLGVLAGINFDLPQRSAVFFGSGGGLHDHASRCISLRQLETSSRIEPAPLMRMAV